MSDYVQGFYEFFAGGGMARLGLGTDWTCLFANEICEKKAAAYRLNFGPSDELKVADVAKLSSRDLPGKAMLAWASFPCQDLSLAGNGKGLRGKRSGTFHPFWNLMANLDREDRNVPLVVLENVVGAITSNEGRDFRTLIRTVVESGHRVGPVVMDASRFVPQSRPRLFILAVRKDVLIPPSLTLPDASTPWHSRALIAAHESLPENLRKAWIWWNLPEPPSMTVTLTELIEKEPYRVDWHTSAETQRLLSLMSGKNREKVQKAQALGRLIVGTIYKRIRLDENGEKIQRAEVRFDQIGGCLRTPVGGSSRQFVLVVKGKSIRSRLLSPREAAALMGVPDYKLPENYNEAYHVMGDGLAVPVVAWLGKHLLAPLASAIHHQSLETASLSTKLMTAPDKVSHPFSAFVMDANLSR